MATQSPESMMKEQSEARRLRTFLSQIARISDSGLYYGETKNEIKSSLEEIHKLTEKALGK